MKVLSAQEFRPLKCAIWQTGKLGFTAKTAKELRLSGKSGIIFYNDNDRIFIEIVNLPNEDAFRIKQAGAYYHGDCAVLFKAMDIDYINNSIIYDMQAAYRDDKKLWSLTPRIAKRKSKKKGGGQ